jgi:bifunctional non-homologous end joining protein LigD
VEITHADRELWPGITKLDLAQYWQTVADVALPGLAHRPLAVVRYAEGITITRYGEPWTSPSRICFGSKPCPRFRMRRRHRRPDRDGADVGNRDPPVGCDRADPLRPDFIVFDLDPREGVPWPEVDWERSRHSAGHSPS